MMMMIRIDPNRCGLLKAKHLVKVRYGLIHSQNRAFRGKLLIKEEVLLNFYLTLQGSKCMHLVTLKSSLPFLSSILEQFAAHGQTTMVAR